MPFTAQEIADAGKVGLDFYMKNKPIDQIGRERPLLQRLMQRSKEFPGAKQYVVEQLRDAYDSNFQWYYGSQSVTYNSRRTVEQAQFEWRGWHDGFYLDEDRLLQNGIVIHDNTKGGNATRAEVLQLTNLLEEQYEALRQGCEEKFDEHLHLDGTQSTEALEGLDKLVSLTPNTGTIGGIDAATNTWWRNVARTGINTAATSLLDEMEIGWRETTRYGGRIDFLLAGEDFIDALRQEILNSGGGANLNFRFENPSSPMKVDPSVASDGINTGIYFKGVPILWDPNFDSLDSTYAPTTTWKKRCYGLSTRHLRLRPASGHNMVSRKPPRQYNKYVWYWALTWKGALCMNKRNAHCVWAIA